jgi:hypothetical protein
MLKDKKSKQIELITPQSKIIANLATRMKYKWSKENGKFAKTIQAEK